MNKRQYKKWRQKHIYDAENKYRIMFTEYLIRNGRTDLIEKVAGKNKLSGSMYLLKNRRIKQELAKTCLSEMGKFNEQETV